MEKTWYIENGTKLVSYTYDAWGKVTTTYHNGGASTAVQYNPFRYRGYYYDTELGFYYINSRYYDPETGRFLNEDGYVSTGQGILGYNMFAYCRNEPVFRKDAYGTEDVCVEIYDEDTDLLDELMAKPSAGSNSGGSSGKTGGHSGGSKGSSSSTGCGGSTNRASNTTPSYQFKNEAKLNEHYTQHNKEMGYKYHSPQEYLADANDVIKNGQYIPGKNAYVRFYNYWGGSNYQFVGMSSNHSYITTFHIKAACKIFE